MLEFFPNREVGCWVWNEGVWGDVLENLELPVVLEPLHLAGESCTPSLEPPLPTQPHVMMAHKPQRRQCSPSYFPSWPPAHPMGKPQLESTEEVLGLERGLHTNSTSHVDRGAVGTGRNTRNGSGRRHWVKENNIESWLRESLSGSGYSLQHKSPVIVGICWLLFK